MKNAALLVMFLAACAADGIEAEHATPTTPLVATVTSTADGAKPIVATGGALAVRIEDTAAIGLEGNASAGYRVEPFEIDRWPNTISPEYWVRANVSGMGSYEIVTSKGIASGVVHSADIASVALVPAAYELDGKSPVAYAANKSAVRVALTDAEGRRLVDATLAIAGGTQTAWDTATLDTVGRLSISGDSLAERTLSVDVVAGAERIESVTVGNRTCFHAYSGATEVVIAMTISGGTQDPLATNCATAGARASL